MLCGKGCWDGRDADAGRDFGYREALREGVFGCREALAPEKGGDPRSGEALPAPTPLSAEHLSAEPFSRKIEPKQKKAGKKCQPSSISRKD